MAHRSAPREDRRRRVLREETRAGSAPRKRRASAGDRLFSEAALERNQPRVTDLLPQRKMAVFKIFALGFGLVASVESLYALREQFLLKYAQIDTRWLDLEGSQTLASCLAALMLIASTVTAILVVHLRRYRMDDYKGRYRIWYAVILLLALAAVDVITQAHRSIVGLAMTTLPNLPVKSASAWCVLAWLVPGGLLWLRAMIDARRCRAVVCVWLLSASGLLVAAALKLGLLPLASHHFLTMARTGSYLFGLQLLSFGLLLYARHLFIRAQGVRRTARPKNVEEDVEVEEPTPVEAENPPAKRTGMFRLPGFGAWRRRGDGGSSSAADVESEDGYTPEELALLESSELTRTERRKLKKQMRLRRRQAA